MGHMLVFFYSVGRWKRRKIRLTHNEAIMPAIVTIEKAVASLEEEKAAPRVVVVGRDAEHTEALPLAKELLLPGVHTVLGSCLRKKTAKNGNFILRS